MKYTTDHKWKPLREDMNGYGFRYRGIPYELNEFTTLHGQNKMINMIINVKPRALDKDEAYRLAVILSACRRGLQIEADLDGKDIPGRTFLIQKAEDVLKNTFESWEEEVTG